MITASFFRSTAILAGVTLLVSCSNASPGDAGQDGMLSIGAVQGKVSDNADALRHKSPRNKEEVVVSGVVTARLLWSSMRGNIHYAFILQNTVEEADKDPATADGIFVYTDRVPTIPLERENHTPQRGDHLVIRGVVEEYFGQTQIKSPVLVRKIAAGVDLDRMVPTVEVNPPEEMSKCPVYWERLECMRVHLAPGAVVTGPRAEIRRNLDSEIVLIPAGAPVLRREDPDARRLYRDPHPLDDIPDRLHDNDNGLRIWVSAMALKGESGSVGTQLPAVRVLDRVANRLDGIVLHGEGGHKFAPSNGLEIQPSSVPVPPVVHHDGAIRIASYNVENLYDFRNDPFDDFDFHNDAKVRNNPSGRADYTPVSEEAYRARLDHIARQITGVLRAPDILLIQETEDQDICVVKDGKLVQTPGNNADGQPDSLQDLALAIRALGGAEYLAACDRDGADERGIICAYLYRKDRVRLAAPDRSPPFFGPKHGVEFDLDFLPFCADSQNPKAFNTRYNILDRGDDDPETLLTRAVQAAHFEVLPSGQSPGKPAELFILNNHFSSRPDRKVLRRTGQARLLAACATAIAGQRPGAWILAGGDLNMYPRPDDPFDPPSDQLRALYDAGLFNVYDDILKREPVWAYSYVHNGLAGTLDNAFLSPSAHKALLHAQFIHINADWSAPGEAPWFAGASDHDPLLLHFRHP